ncbi:Undecaprenyl-phosphate galactosephosphotransferase [Chitinispirillum alkaliphilum]|nr:Undecaprenyl-phosphate galactosephosphotransferase [Chitinispirillum alkaliphilum]
MLKEHSSFVKQTIAGVDCLLILASFLISYSYVGLNRSLSPLSSYWLMVFGFTFFYLYFAWTRSLFSVLQFNWMHNLFPKTVMIFISCGFLGASILYLIPESRNSRYLYVTFSVVSFMVITAEKLLIKQGIAFARRKNKNTSPVIVLGRGRGAAQLCHEIETHKEWGLRIVRKIDLSISASEFEDVLRNSYVEEVFFCVPRRLTREGITIDPLLEICEEMGRPARVFLNISGAAPFARWEYQNFMDRSTLISATVELDPDQLIFKRVFDIIGSLFGVLLLLALYPFLAIAIKITSRGPVFFRQIRVGKHGKRFVIYKFRSMYTDAEKRKKDLLELNQCDGAIFKLKDDPRITPVGVLIRKFSLDELPQFINVLRGEMSLVGTRPPTPDEVKKYQKWHHRRISIRPGITGLWQVSGRNKITDFDEIVKLDLKYIDNWSIWLDVKIIFKTILVLFERDSAF